MKVGDLVRFSDGRTLANETRMSRSYARYRTKGIILSFDEDNDPVVFWFDSSHFGEPEENFRRHIVVLSEC